jgi:hypothetical protein
MKILYLAVSERRPNRTDPTGRVPDWKSMVNTPGDHLRRPPHNPDRPAARAAFDDLAEKWAPVAPAIIRV